MSRGDNSDHCYLGYQPKYFYYDYDHYTGTFVKKGHNPEVCRLGLAASYISMILSLIMLCEEGWKRETATSTAAPLGGNVQTLKLVVGILMFLLWLATLILSLWGWIIFNDILGKLEHLSGNNMWSKNGLEGRPSMRAAAAFYIIFQALSVMSWVKRYIRIHE